MPIGFQRFCKCAKAVFATLLEARWTSIFGLRRLFGYFSNCVCSQKLIPRDRSRLELVMQMCLTERPEWLRKQRFIAALVLLWVFALPLHIHSAGTATQTDQECVCQQGKRTLFIPVTVGTCHQPTGLVSFVSHERFELPDSLAVSIKRSRSPPAVCQPA